MFLHEGLGCAAMWKDFPDALAEASGLDAFIYSRRGYGASDPADVPRIVDYLDPEALEVLPAVLEAAGIARPILIGHSDGASIALIYAGGLETAAPLGLVLEAPHVFCEELSVENIAGARDAYLNSDLRQRLARYHGDNVDHTFWGWNDIWLDPDFMNWNIEKRLPGVAAPVLLIQGRQDQYGTLAQLEAIEAQVPAPVERLMLDDCRHSPHVDRRQATLAAMTGFVGKLTR